MTHIFNSFEMVIEPKPKKFDHDNVRFLKNGKEVGFGFKAKGGTIICMIKCPSCERENWSIAVSTGSCAWCGYNPNKYENN